MFAFEEGGDFGHCVAGVIECNEEALGAIGADHCGLEQVDVGASNFVALFDLDGIPLVHEVEFAGGFAGMSGHGADGVNAAVNAHVADLDLVGDTAESDDGPIFELEGRHLAKLLFGPRQITDYETLAVEPVVFVLTNFADIAQALGHDAASGRGDVDANPLTTEILGRDKGSAATTESVEDDVVGV